MGHGAAHTMLVTMVTAIAAGVLLIALGRRSGLPAIVLLLAGGLALGPEGAGLIDPGSLGEGLSVIVSLAVGLILFEGGLTLDIRAYRAASGVIRRLLTYGVLVTWGVTSLAVFLLLDHSIGVSVIAGSLVIVTGPTVIGPLLKRVRVQQRLHGVLHWEGILIDPVGVFVALLCFEWVGEDVGHTAFISFVMRFAVGLAVGLAGGFVIYEVIRRRFAPAEMLEVVAFAMAVLLFGLTEAIVPEAGLLSMTVAGFVVGVKRPQEFRQILAFKAQITDLAIGTLFMLLTARLSPYQFAELGWPGVAAVGAVMFLARPLSVFICTARQGFCWREKAFLSWISPRGIVAASMASLIALSLERNSTIASPRFVETFTYSVIVGTIVLQSFTAGPLARLLRVARSAPAGWMVVSGRPFPLAVARFLRETLGETVVVVDTNPGFVRDAEEAGLEAIQDDARDLGLVDRHVALQNVGNLLALTDNESLNQQLCVRWAERLGPDHVFRWDTASDGLVGDRPIPGRVVWPALPKPSRLSGELARSEAWLMWGDDSERIAAPGNQALLSAVGGTLRFLPDASNGKPRGEPGSAGVLYLRREADYLLRAVRPELFVRGASEDPNELFPALLRRMSEVTPGTSLDGCIQEVLAQDEMHHSSLGHGVAVPHAYSDCVSERLCAVAILDNGLNIPARDDVPVQLVFLLVSPMNDPEGHLATLAEIARVVADDAVRHRLLAARNAAELLKTLRGAHEH